jgi:peptidoglycan/LPS O-acetylase OafA/YrhL
MFRAGLKPPFVLARFALQDTKDGVPTSYRRAELDGVRAFAILAVMYFHFATDGLSSWLGTLGVHLFFVLSGYLITGILLGCRDSVEAGKSTMGRVLKVFYIRRALRILPVYYLCLVGIWIFGNPDIRWQFWWHTTFNSNLLFVFTPFTDLTAQFWTLSVEEQFYLFWPAVILLVPRRFLFPVLLAVIASGPLYRLLCALAGISGNAVNIVTIACFDSLGIGALLAYLESDDRKRGILLKLGLWSVPVPILLAILGTPENAYVNNVVRTLDALAFAWIIARDVGPSKALVFRALRSRFLVPLGVVSYGAYVIHPAVADMVRSAYRHLLGHELYSGRQLFLLGAVSTFLLATASWKLLEQPINALKGRWPYTNKAGARAQVGAMPPT